MTATKRRRPAAPCTPLVWPRANAATLSQFDLKTKLCTMNCGPHIQDPRDEAERKLLCTDCASVQPPALPTPDMIEAICAELAAHEGKPWPDGYGELTQGLRRFAAREGYLAALAAATSSTSRRQL